MLASFSVQKRRHSHTVKKRDTGIAEILNEGILFAKQASNHPWFDYNIDHASVAQKLKQMKAASNHHTNSSAPRSVKEIVTEMLTNLLTSPLITLKSQDDHSLTKFKDFSSTSGLIQESSSSSSSSSSTIESQKTSPPSPPRNKARIPLTQDSVFLKILEKLQGTNMRLLSPRLVPLLPFGQDNVTNIGSPDLLSFFQQNSSISLPSMLQTLGYNNTESTLWMSVVGEASGVSDILRQLQYAYKLAESDDSLQHSRIAFSTDGQSVPAEELPYSLQ